MEFKSKQPWVLVNDSITGTGYDSFTNAILSNEISEMKKDVIVRTSILIQIDDIPVNENGEAFMNQIPIPRSAISRYTIPIHQSPKFVIPMPTIEHGGTLVINKKAIINKTLTVDKTGLVFVYKNIDITGNLIIEGGTYFYEDTINIKSGAFIIVKPGGILYSYCNVSATLNIDEGGNLQVDGNFVFVGQEININGNVKVSGDFIFVGRKLNVKGTLEVSGNFNFKGFTMNIYDTGKLKIYDVGKLGVSQGNVFVNSDISILDRGWFRISEMCAVYGIINMLDDERTDKNENVNTRLTVGTLIIQKSQPNISRLELDKNIVIEDGLTLTVANKFSLMGNGNILTNMILKGTLNVNGLITIAQGVKITIDKTGAMNVNNFRCENSAQTLTIYNEINIAGNLTINGTFTGNQKCRVNVNDQGSVDILGAMNLNNDNNVIINKGGILNLGTVDKQSVININTSNYNNPQLPMLVSKMNVYGTLNVYNKGTVNVFSTIDVTGSIKIMSGGKVVLKLPTANITVDVIFLINRVLNGDPRVYTTDIEYNCFAFDSLAITPTGEKRCGDLVLGEKVLVDHKGTFEPILFFGHRENQEALFVELLLKNGKSMSATPQHYIFVYNQRKKTMIPIQNVKIGDFVKYNGKRVKVEQISILQKKGFVSPMTKSCEIIIDGVQASCCTDKYTLAVLKPLVDAVDALGITIPLQVVDQIRDAANLVIHHCTS
jgi:hypothetical protein